MTQSVEQSFPDPFGEVGRRQLNNATVMASFAEAVARWRYTRRQEVADRDARQADEAAAAAELERRDAEVIRRFNAAQHRAAAAVYQRAASDEFLLHADLHTLAHTWGAAAPYHDQDPHAADAMRRVEVQLRIRQPDAMAEYDTLRAAGATPADAMFKAAPLMDPTSHSTPPGRPAGARAGSLGPEPATGGDLVRVGRPGDVPRPPAGVDLLRQLRSVDDYLATVAATASGDRAWVDRISETRAQLGNDIGHIETVLRSTRPSVTAAFELAMHRWVPLQTAVKTTDLAAATDPASRFNELQRQVAAAVYTQTYDPLWPQQADDRRAVGQLGEAWAAAAAYPRDRRARKAQRHIEGQLRQLRPAAMGIYNVLCADGMSPQEAMLRAAPVMEPGREPLYPTEWPVVMAATKRGDVATPPVAEQLPTGPGEADQLRQRLRQRLHALDRHLHEVIDDSAAGATWRNQAYTVLAELGEEMQHLAGTGPGRPQTPAGRRPAAPTATAPELAGDGLPAPAAAEVAQARQSRAGRPARPARNDQPTLNPAPHRTAGSP